MKKSKRIASILLSLLIVGQFGLVNVALADDGGSPSPTPSDSPSPSPDPLVSPSPDPSPDPSASPSPDPSASPSLSPSPDPSPNPSPSPTPSKHHKDNSDQTGPSGSTGPQTTTGATGCGGNPPKWVFDVASNQWQPSDINSFTCDPTTGYYLSSEYFYNQHDGWYEIIPPAQVASLPTYFITAPNVVHTVFGDLLVGSATYQVAQAMGLLGSGGIQVASTGSGSGSTSSITSGSQNYIDLTNLVNIMNTLQSVAGSGSVSASQNTQVGDSVSGAASVMANLINLLASAWSWSNGNLAFFMQNLGLDGQNNQDVKLTPGDLGTGGGGSLGNGTSSDVNVNAQNDGSIVNNIDLAAVSGDASANSNTSAGNVGTGNAQAEINIMNLINSFILSGNSFFGVLNIFNNYSGDILFPDGFLNGMVGSGTNDGAVGNGTTQTDVNTAQANLVNNNITTTAASGNAEAGDNGSVGQVTSGNATTQQNTFNLSNTSIFGDNAVLVIVNVLGHWVGKIMNVPTGTTTSALLTDNATVSGNGGAGASVGSTGPNSGNQLSAGGDSSLNSNNTSTGSITNNVNVGAKSGDASATDNTGVGNVSTGNASAASSVTNIFNSVLNVKHWFGVLVINVFGNWFGDVGDNSSAGDQPQTPAPQTAGALQTAAAMPQVGLVGLFTGGGSPAANNVGGGSSQVSSNGGGKVLTAAAEQPAPINAKEAAKSRDMSILFILSAIVMLVAGALTSIDRKLKQAR